MDALAEGAPWKMGEKTKPPVQKLENRHPGSLDLVQQDEGFPHQGSTRDSGVEHSPKSSGVELCQKPEMGDQSSYTSAPSTAHLSAIQDKSEPASESCPATASVEPVAVPPVLDPLGPRKKGLSPVKENMPKEWPGALWDAPRHVAVVVESGGKQATPTAQISPSMPADAPVPVELT